MTGALSYDAVVIGAGVNGLAAATYLAMAGKRVLVAEQRATAGGLCETGTFAESFLFSKAAHALHALDPRVVKELKLARHGLQFAVRDLPLVGLRADGKHIVLSRDGYATARNIALQSEADAGVWPQFRREWYGLGRKLRTLWWNADAMGPGTLLHSDKVHRIAHMGTAAWLDSWFESDAIKATLGFDAHAMSPLAAGSALLLLWRAAQEMCGLQGAVAIPRGGLRAVTDALAGSANSVGVELRTGAAVNDVLIDDDGCVRGVSLASGEVVAAPLVLSSLPRGRTLSFPGLQTMPGFAEAAALRLARPGLGTARVTIALDAPPQINGIAVPAVARLVLLDRLESLVAGHAAAYAGHLPHELTMEVVMPVAADPVLAPAGHHIVSVLVSPVPVAIAGGWHALKPVLAAQVVAALGHHFAGLARHLVAVEVLTPDDVRGHYGAEDSSGGAVDAQRLLADWRVRVATSVPGLVLCGADADPVGAVSGRGGRVAAAYVFAQGARR